MPGLTIHTGNRLENLANHLAALTEDQPLPPLTPETIIVQNPGMARWLLQTLARHQGVCANLKFDLPNAFIKKICRQILDLPDRSVFSEEIILWHLMEILPELTKKPGFEMIRSYLADGRQLKQFQLADRLAGLFDLYAVFRPEMIMAWDNDSSLPSGPARWQCLLWRELSARIKNHSLRPDPNQAMILRDCLAALQTSPGPAKLPPRLTIFGVSSMPPSHLELFNGLARHLDLRFFILNPCLEFWDDIYTSRESLRISRQKKMPAAALFFEEGHPLLASLGRLGRDCMAMLHQLDYQEDDFFEEPGENSLLAAIQSDILHLRNRGAGHDLEPRPAPRAIVSANDQSILLQICHSPMRELEVLRDHILDLFCRDPELLPHDILVVTPDINSYAPFIQAVFDAPAAGTPKIPFSISARHLPGRNRISAPLLAILDLPGSRITAPQIFGILEEKTVSSRLGIAAAELNLIRKWLEETRIRWGIDPQHRRAKGFAALNENTWQAGFDRLLLGYAMANRPEKMFADILPYDRIEGGQADLLGKLLNFCDGLFKLIPVLEKDHTLTEWSGIISRIITDFFSQDEETGQDIQLFQKKLNELVEQENRSGFSGKLTIEVIRSLTTRLIEQKSDLAGQAGLLAGAVNFCDLLTMRAVPTKILCLVGMDDSTFPRPDQKASFDLLAADPRPGDRSRRLDDRYLFLESILSARVQLYISYVGQSFAEDGIQPPSVLVNELLDYIAQAYTLPDNNPGLVEHLTMQHRRQPFSPDYFSSRESRRPALYSYAEENCQAARALQSAKSEAGPLITAPLSEPAAEFRQVEINQLLNFFTQPARFFLNNRLAIHLPQRRNNLAEGESFSLAGLDKYQIETGILDCLSSGRDLQEYFETIKAAGYLPLGPSGEHAFRKIQAEAKGFWRLLEEWLGSEPLPPLDLDLNLGGFRLHGRLNRLYECGLVFFRSATVKPKDHLKAWIQHLAGNAAQQSFGTAQYPGTCILAGKKSIYRFQPVGDAETQLSELLSLYWQGLSKPLVFFPETSYAFARSRTHRKTADEAVSQARRAWLGDDFSKGECEDEYYRLCFRDTIPLDDNFTELAMKLYAPLLAHQEKMI